MSRTLRAAILLLALASCGGGNYSAPHNLDDACAILAQRPPYWKAMKATERRWGVPVSVQMAAIYQESKFVGNARTPHRYALGVIPMGRQSSAYGYSQALDGTWEEYQQAEGGRGTKRDSIAVGGIADLARLAEVRTRVLAVAIDDDRTMPAAAVDRLADQLDVPVVRVDVATGAKPDAHLRWVAASPGHVVTAIEAWAAGSVG
mgnify:CR=1 FL=1